MPRLPIVLAVAGLALAGCSQQSDEAQGQAQASASAKAMAQALRPEPGQYRVATKFTNISIPGLPPAAAEQAKKMFSSTGNVTEYCLTPQQASMGYEEMTKRAAQGKCTYEHFSATGGKLDAAMTCETGRGMTTKMTMNGTFSPTGSNMTMVSEASAAGMPGGGMHMEGSVVTERLGDCT